MPKFLRLPKIGMNMEEGVITEWLVKPGDYIEKEQMVVRAETDKSVQDMFATDSGILYKYMADPGDTIPCQGKIAMLLDEGEEPPVEEEGVVTEEVKVEVTEPVAKTVASEKVVASVTATSVNGRIRISPLAKKLAKEFGIPIELLTPSKEGARIVKADVLRAKEEGVTEKKVSSVAIPVAEDEFIPFTTKRKVIAKRMVESTTTKPRVSLVTTVNFEPMIELRTILKAQQKVSFNELIMKACATALKKHPELNIHTAEGGVIRKGDINIGFAVDNSAGLMVPVIRNVDRKGFYELSTEFYELADKVKANQLSLDEMTGATFTISNLGMFGVESFDPIINVPECFILGIGSTIETPVVVGGEIKIQKCMKISLCFDHTVVDGAPAARLLQDIKLFIENPVMMLA